jgi:hypothetical protein
MKKLINYTLLTIMMVSSTFALEAQTADQAPQTKTPAKYQPKEKTRRFLLRYLTAVDTMEGDRENMQIVKGFETVADATNDDWISQYHAAFYNAVLGAEMKDSVIGNAMLKKADFYVTRAAALTKDESEVVLLQAMINGIKIGRNPQLGATLGPEVMKGYEKAKTLNPENPRAYVVLGESYLNMPEAAGGGKKKAKEMFEIALKKFENDKHDDPAWPRWGKDRATELLKKTSDK